MVNHRRCRGLIGLLVFQTDTRSGLRWRHPKNRPRSLSSFSYLFIGKTADSLRHDCSALMSQKTVCVNANCSFSLACEFSSTFLRVSPFCRTRFSFVPELRQSILQVICK